MMKVCGVEIKGNDAIVCLLTKSDELFDIPDCRTSRLTLQKTDREQVQQFQFAFVKLMEDYKVDKVVIRERLMKGKFAGSALGFKMEAAIQCSAIAKVELLSPTMIKEAAKQHPLPIRFEDTGLRAFQEGAFMTAYASLVSTDSRI